MGVTSAIGGLLNMLLCGCVCRVQEAAEDVRTLARLWQLQAKMQTVDGGQGSAYEARIERVCSVAGGVEQRLAKRLELLDGYARVMNMIEIEVEMDMQVRMYCLIIAPGVHVKVMQMQTTAGVW